MKSPKQILLKMWLRTIALYMNRESDRKYSSILLAVVLALTPIFICAILSLWFNVSPLWYVGLSVFWVAPTMVVHIISEKVYSFLEGEVHGIMNPRNGETWVELEHEGEVFWKSEKFIPLPALPGVSKVDAIKKYSRVQKRHEYIWRIIKPVVERSGTYDAMREALKSKLVKPIPTDNTLREIIKEFEK